MDRINVEVDKPAKRVLVHWVDVGQISNAEEEDRGVLSNSSVTLSRLCYLRLCLICNLGKKTKTKSKLCFPNSHILLFTT